MKTRTPFVSRRRDTQSSPARPSADYLTSAQMAYAVSVQAVGGVAATCACATHPGAGEVTGKLLEIRAFEFDALAPPPVTTFGLGHQACADLSGLVSFALAYWVISQPLTPSFPDGPAAPIAPLGPCLPGRPCGPTGPWGPGGPAVAQPAIKATHARAVITLMTTSPVSR